MKKNKRKGSRVEVLFHSSSTPKVFKNVYAVYTKGGFACLHLADDLIIKYPLCNIFSVAQYHRPHLGSQRKRK